MMRILLIYPYCTQASDHRWYPVEPLGVLYLASYLRAELPNFGSRFEVKILPEHVPDLQNVLALRILQCVQNNGDFDDAFHVQDIGVDEVGKLLAAKGEGLGAEEPAIPVSAQPVHSDKGHAPTVLLKLDAHGGRKFDKL